MCHFWWDAAAQPSALLVWAVGLPSSLGCQTDEQCTCVKHPYILQMTRMQRISKVPVFIVPKIRSWSAISGRTSGVSSTGYLQCSALTSVSWAPPAHLCAPCKTTGAASGLVKADRFANANVFPLIRINDHMVAWLTKFPNSQGRKLFLCQTLQNLHLKKTF